MEEHSQAGSAGERPANDRQEKIELGRLRERLIEGARLLPAFLKLNLQLCVIGLRGAGKSDEEIDALIEEMSADVMSRSDAGLKHADARYERKRRAKEPQSEQNK
jgi:hypothetical protein